jgi:hypothetical protein
MIRRSDVSFQEVGMPGDDEVLPVFRTAVGSAGRIDNAVQRLLRRHKHGLGARLRVGFGRSGVRVARADGRSARTDSKEEDV